MSERKVNLRVSAVGGDRLKAELRSIGKEGQHALTLIEGGAPAASRGLSATSAAADELMARLSRLSLQAAQAAANMNTVGGAGSSVQARINAVAGVSGRGSRDAEDIAAYGRALDDVRAKMNPLFAEMRRHEEAIGEIDRAWRVGAITLDEWVSATRREEAANASSAASIRQKQAAFENFVNTGLRDAIDAINGVTGSLARTSEDMDAFGRAMDDARAKFSPLYAETRRHGEALQEMQRLYKAGILTEQEFVAATQREVAAHGEATAAIRQRQAALANMVNTGLRDAIDANTGVSGDRARSAEDIAAYGRALDETRAKYNPMFAAVQRYRSELAQLKAAHQAGAVSADEYSAALSRLRQQSLHDIGVIKGRIQGYQAMEKGAGMARFQIVQLGYQLNDIGVSLASGQNPLIVMVQQGAQIAQIYGNGQGGVSAMLRQVGGLVTGLVTKLWPLMAVIGVGSAVIGGMTHEINQLGGETVSFGDTALAVFQVIGRGVWQWIKPAADKISEWFWDAYDLVAAGVVWTGNALINGFKIAVDGIGTAIGIVPDLFEAGFSQAVSNALTKLHDLVWYVGEAMNKIAATMNEVFGTNLSTSNLAGTIKSLSDASGSFSERAGAARGRIGAAWDGFTDRTAETWAEDPLGEFFNAVAGQAQKNARARKDKDNKGGGGSEKDEAEDLIKTLERELAVLKETDPIKKKMLEYSKPLANATDEQRAKVEGLVVALDKERNGWAAIPRALAEYAEEAKRFGDDVGQALVGAFKGAEDALVDFIKTGKLSFSDLATSIIADLARIAIRSSILGPIAGVLGNALGGPFGSALSKAFVQHTGGPAGSGPMRYVSAANFINAPRLHDGMGGLRADEYAAILQRGERVLNRRETREYEGGRSSPVVVNFNGVRDAQSFRQSRTQIAADLGRAVAMSRRGI